jgi:Lipocalin-like domain
MSPLTMRTTSLSYAGSSLLWLICWCVPLCQAATADRVVPPHLTRQQLIGAWRLVSIEFSGQSGPVVDPFYQADSVGIIVYDSSGWMSVQIAAPQRRAWKVPASRLPPAAGAHETQLKAAAFDTYYAYFGTWDYDEATSVVTHHVKSSLLPAETGLNYAQRVTLEGGRLIFTGRDGKDGKETIRRKVWERSSSVTQ